MTAPKLEFSVDEVAEDKFAAAPTLKVALNIERITGGRVRSILLTTAVNIAPARRSYDEQTQQRLVDLFGELQQWDSSLRELAWERPTVVVPPFTDNTVVTLRLPCSSDFELATTKYLNAVREGDVVLELLFSGTMFYAAEDGNLRTAQLDWEQETTTAFPIATWRKLMERFYGQTRWVRVGEETFDRLAAYKATAVVPTVDEAIGALLDECGKDASRWKP